MTPTVGYFISSHVAQNHAIIPPLLQSMEECGIAAERIVVVVNGSGQPHDYRIRGVRFLFQQPEFAYHLLPVLTEDFGFSHIFFLNGTSRCGPRFRELVETGFDPAADCTLAGDLIGLGSVGRHGRAINDLCMYRTGYLLEEKARLEEISEAGGASRKGIVEMEGVLYAVAPRQAQYPTLGHQVTGPTDVYGTGTPRITEYYPGIDWYRFKKNWGHLAIGSFKPSTL